MDIAAAQAFLDANFAPWVMALQPKVTAITKDSVFLDIPITPDIARVGGIVSGQTLAALADTAMVVACRAKQDAESPLATVTLDTQFLRPATGDTITADAQITRMGRSMVFATCRLTAQPGDKPVAFATATIAK